MAATGSRNIFLSCVTAEFAREGEPYGDVRPRLFNYFTRAEYQVRVQENFRQTPTGTLEKLDAYIRECDAVIHIVGTESGSVAAPEAVRSLIASLEKEGRPFLTGQSALRETLGDLTGITYTQWEAFLAAHRGVDLYVYYADGAKDAHPHHFDRLKACPGRRYGEPFTDFADLIGKIFADLHPAFPEIEKPKPARPFNIPDSIGELFKGREPFLREIRQTLQSGKAGAITQTHAIAGLGGIGKTRLAIEYAHRYAEDYDALLFLRADTPDALEQNLANLTGPLVLNLPEGKATDTTQNERAAAALRWLEQHPNWFLIVDNIDTDEAARALQDHLGRLSNGHVLITSRIGKWAGKVKRLDLGVLDEQAARDFLIERTGDDRVPTATDDTDLDELVQTLDGLALALEQAGAYIAAEEISFADYLKDYRENLDTVLTWHDEVVSGYPHSVAVTWQTTFDQLTGSARDLLAEISFLSPAPIPRAWFPDDRAALTELRRYSLIKFLTEPPETFQVHRLVQAIVEGRLGEEKEKVWGRLTGKLKGALPGAGWKFENWGDWALFEPHAEAVFGREGEFADTVEVASLLLRFGDYEEGRNGNYKAAESLLRRSLEVHEALLGSEHPNTLTSINNLAHLLDSKGDYEEAEPLYRRSLEAQERVLGPEHPDTLTSVNNLAALLRAKGQYAEAEPLYRRALEARERVLGPEHPDTLTGVNNLAGLLDSKGEYAEAEPLYRRALEAQERVLGPEHPDTLGSVNNLALLLKSKGEYAEAEPLYRRALEAKERVLGPEHPDTLMSVNNLAFLLDSKGDYEEAEPLYRRALEAKERVLGPEHPSTLTSVNNLAGLLYTIGDYTEAEPLYRRAVEGFEKVLGPDHPNTKIVQANHQACLDAMNRDDTP